MSPFEETAFDTAFFERRVTTRAELGYAYGNPILPLKSAKIAVKTWKKIA